MNIQYSKQALKFLLRQNKPTQERLITAIKKLPEGDVKKMQGLSLYRLRVGDFRILFARSGQIINIEKIDNRGQIYK